jgi:hypothetical protein
MHKPVLLRESFFVISSTSAAIFELLHQSRLFVIGQESALWRHSSSRIKKYTPSQKKDALPPVGPMGAGSDQGQCGIVPNGFYRRTRLRHEIQPTPGLIGAAGRRGAWTEVL